MEETIFMELHDPLETEEDRALQDTPHFSHNIFTASSIPFCAGSVK